MSKRVYLDNHSAKRPFDRALGTLLSFYQENWGAVSAPHQMGQNLHAPLNQAIQKLYELVGASDQDQFIYTNGSEDAAFRVLYAHYFADVRESGRNQILTTIVEEAPILMGIQQLEKGDVAGKMLPVNAQGQLTKESVLQAIGPRTSLLALSWANKLTGVIHPMLDIAEVCKQKGVKLFVDASEVVGKLYFRFQDLQADYLAFDGNSVHAPQGTGALFMRKERSIDHSAKILNPAGLCALAQACEKSCNEFDHMCTETARLRDKLEQGIQDGVPGAFPFFRESDRLPNCSAISFPGVVGEALLYALHQRGIYASIGGGRMQKLSHVLSSCGVESPLAHSAVSFSLSYETMEEEIDYAIEVIVSTALKMQKYSEALR